MAPRSARLADAQREFQEWRDAQQLEQEAHQPSLLDPGSTLTLDDAIESVTEHAGDEWRERALEAVRLAATVFEYVTSDQVNLYLPDDSTVDLRALGGIMRRAAGLGWITNTRTYRTSNRPSTHSRPLLVWRSQIHGSAS